MSKVEYLQWIDSLLAALDASGVEGGVAAAYLRAHGTRLGFFRVGRHIGAFWTPWKSVGINQVHFSHDTLLTDPRLLTIVIHEVRHLRQGMLTALSIYGELDAWQLQYRLYEQMTRPIKHPALVEMLSLPLCWDRSVLRRARELMQAYAGKAYRADLLPLYPLHHEINYLLTRRPPSGV